jgi:hypothetical protein
MDLSVILDKKNPPINCGGKLVRDSIKMTKMAGAAPLEPLDNSSKSLIFGGYTQLLSYKTE